MKVFLVDDEPSALIVLSKMLDEADMQGAFSLNSSDGVIEKIVDFMPDVIILDLYMPDVDGVGLAEQIRDTEELDNIPIIAISASEDIRDRMRIIEAGFSQFLPKPVDKNALLNVIQTQVKLSRIVNSTREALLAMKDY